MIPARTFRTALLVSVLSLAAVVLGHELFYQPYLRSVLAHGEALVQDTPAEALEREIRAAVPPGSSRSAVETLLRSRHLPYGYQSADEIEAVARGLKGGAGWKKSTLKLRFYFDSKAMLQRVDSRIDGSDR